MIAIQATFILFLSYFLTLKLAKYFQLNQITITVIFIFKTIICLLYIPISIGQDLDSTGYFIYALTAESSNALIGSGLITSIVKFLRIYFHLNIYSVTFLFSFIGNIGTLAFISNVRHIGKKTERELKFLITLVVFLPTLNIWITAIGKDAIVFACINLIIFSFLNLRSRLIILFISAILFFIIRPIVGVILFLSIAIALLMKNNLPTFKKLFIGIASLVSLYTVNLLNAMNYPALDLGNLRFTVILAALDYYAEVTAEGNNSISLVGMPFPLKLFSFMFRPLFFDANNFYTLLMSFENFILILIFIYPIFKMLKYLKFKYLAINSLTVFLTLYSIIGWLFYSLTIANLGTANRYKLMFLPALILLSLIISEKSKSSISNDRLIR